MFVEVGNEAANSRHVKRKQKLHQPTRGVYQSNEQNILSSLPRNHFKFMMRFELTLTIRAYIITNLL